MLFFGVENRWVSLDLSIRMSQALQPAAQAELGESKAMKSRALKEGPLEARQPGPGPPEGQKGKARRVELACKQATKQRVPGSLEFFFVVLEHFGVLKSCFWNSLCLENRVFEGFEQRKEAVAVFFWSLTV